MSLDAPLAPDQSELLLDTAEVAIRACLEGVRYPGPDVERLPERLRQPCGAFVTLHVDGQLNGCIGNIDSDEPVGTCIAKVAIQAAFDDPRLPRLHARDLPGLDIEISLLSSRTAVPCSTPAELLDHLIAGVHGLIITSGRLHAVFLPSVWNQLPDPNDFVLRLFDKAGLPTGSWPTDLSAEIFTVESFGRHVT